MENKKDAFQQWQELVYSGKRIHPVTEKNMPTTPPLREDLNTSVPPNRVALDLEPMPKKSRRSPLIIILGLLCLLFLGYLIHILNAKDPGEEIKAHKAFILEDRLQPMINSIVAGVVYGIQELIPERVVVQEKVKIVRVKDNGQKAAIEQVKAWERVNNKLIDEFYNNKELRGQRKLCLTLGGKEQCSIIDTIDLRPELPPYLRRERDLM